MQKKRDVRRRATERTFRRQVSARRRRRKRQCSSERIQKTHENSDEIHHNCNAAAAQNKRSNGRCQVYPSGYSAPRHSFSNPNHPLTLQHPTPAWTSNSKLKSSNSTANFSSSLHPHLLLNSNPKRRHTHTPTHTHIQLGGLFCQVYPSG